MPDLNAMSNAMSLRTRAERAALQEARQLSPEATKMKQAIVKAVLADAAKAADRGEMSHSSCIANLAGPERATRDDSRVAAVEQQEKLLEEAFPAVEAELVGRGFTIVGSNASVSDYTGAVFAHFNISW